MARHEVLDRAGAQQIVAELATWDAAGGYVPGLHAGDVGWHLRAADEVLAGTMHAWFSGSTLDAVALLEGSTARARARPDLVSDPGLSREVADAVEAMPGEELWVDPDNASGVRQELVARGWALDPAPWVSLYASGRDWVTGDRGDVRLGSSYVPGRVVVQRQGFANSTFDEPSWHRMAAGPGFRADLDLVLLANGEPAAAGTGWLSVDGGPAILEPLATHPDHRGKGLGRAAAAAIVDACLAAGASGVSVVTPRSNEAAVATYVAAGFRPVETVQGLTLTR